MKIHPMSTVVIVEPIEEDAGLLINGKILWGKVLACGPQCSTVAEGDIVYIKDVRHEAYLIEGLSVRLIMEENIPAKMGVI